MGSKKEDMGQLLLLLLLLLLYNYYNGSYHMPLYWTYS